MGIRKIIAASAIGTAGLFNTAAAQTDTQAPELPDAHQSAYQQPEGQDQFRWERLFAGTAAVAAGASSLLILNDLKHKRDAGPQQILRDWKIKLVEVTDSDEKKQLLANTPNESTDWLHSNEFDDQQRTRIFAIKIGDETVGAVRMIASNGGEEAVLSDVLQNMHESKVLPLQPVTRGDGEENKVIEVTLATPLSTPAIVNALRKIQGWSSALTATPTQAHSAIIFAVTQKALEMAAETEAPQLLMSFGRFANEETLQHVFATHSFSNPRDRNYSSTRYYGEDPVAIIDMSVDKFCKLLSGLVDGRTLLPTDGTTSRRSTESLALGR